MLGGAGLALLAGAEVGWLGSLCSPALRWAEFRSLLAVKGALADASLGALVAGW